MVVYSKAHCPQCVVAKNKLDAAGVAYEEIRVDLDQSARSMIIGMGFRSVPVIFKAGEPVKLEDLLNNKG